MESKEHLPPVVKSLGFVSFFNDLASEMVYPLIPALVTALGGGALSLGLLDGISDAISAGAKLWAGRLADQTRLRRPLIVGGYFLAAITRPVIGVAGRAWQVIVLRATDRIGKGIRNPPRDAVIADATSPEMRGRAFGFHRSMDHAGAVVGPLVAWALISRFGMQPAQVITWAVVPGILAVVVVLWAMKEAGKAKREKGTTGPSRAPAPSRSGNRSIVFYLIVLFWLAKFPETLLLLRLQDLGMPVAVTPLVWAALHVIRTSGSYPGGRVSDRFGPARTMVCGWLVYAVVCVGLATARSALAGGLWFLVFGLVSALTESPERAFVSNIRSTLGTGSRFGAYHAATGLAALAGGLLFGLLYSRLGAGPALLASAAGTAALMVAGIAGWKQFGAAPAF